MFRPSNRNIRIQPIPDNDRSIAGKRILRFDWYLDDIDGGGNPMAYACEEIPSYRVVPHKGKFQVSLNGNPLRPARRMYDIRKRPPYRFGRPCEAAVEAECHWAENA